MTLLHGPRVGPSGVRRAAAQSLLAALLLAACSDAPVLHIVPTNRVVLAEFFTWQRCSYCPYAARALDSLATEFADSVVVIAYHRRMAGDTLSPDYVETRCEYYYGSGGEPATVFDGGQVIRTSDPDQNHEVFRNQILAAKSARPGIQLELTGSTGTDSLTVTASVSGVDSTPAETLRLFIVVVEDSVPKDLLGASDSVFNNVMRAMLPGVDGAPVFVTRGDTVTVTERTGMAARWDRERLGIVAFVQRTSSHDVLQAARIGRLEQQE
jgi:thiol-disulfide isomerase/thioredoxin